MDVVFYEDALNQLAALNICFSGVSFVRPSQETAADTYFILFTFLHKHYRLLLYIFSCNLNHPHINMV